MSQSLPKLAAVNSPVELELYEVRRTIHPRAVHGWFASWRITLVVLTQVAFYGTAWLTWNGRQAVLFDLASRKFYIFGMVLWPQDFIFLTALLIISALSLFLFTAVAGRLWCGYACPQTVYTEIFMWIERRIEGDRMARMKLDQQPAGLRKVGLKATKHASWIALALWTGFTFVGYFTPIKTLAAEVAGNALGPWETFWILFYGFATYGNAGWMREQVCKHMCPYARFQSVMFDSDTLVITYDAERGEPRGSRSKSADPKAVGLGACVDCGICVQACPTGIDMTDTEKTDPSQSAQPRYWVKKSDTESVLRDRTARQWLMGWRDITNSTNERTVIAGVVPRVGVGHTMPLFFTAAGDVRFETALLGNWNSLVFDFVARQKVGGTHLTYGYLKQFPAPRPSDYTPADINFIQPRVLELVFTATDLAPFANDLGYKGKPFAWTPDRRTILRAELDAYYAKLYGLTRDELRYILDPSDIYGDDYPSVTFPGLKKNEVRDFGEYRTRRLVLDAWDKYCAQ